MSITLIDIKKKQDKLAELIANFEQQSKSVFGFPETQIELNNGEHYAGIILGKDGEPSHHLILMNGEAQEVNWQQALDWAKENGGSLPNRREQALLFANLKEEFEERAYWSSEEHASSSSNAWSQSFGNGYQYYGYESYNLRARAVRRLVI